MTRDVPGQLWPRVSVRVSHTRGDEIVTTLSPELADDGHIVDVLSVLSNMTDSNSDFVTL